LEKDYSVRAPEVSGDAQHLECPTAESLEVLGENMTINLGWLALGIYLYYVGYCCLIDMRADEKAGRPVIPLLSLMMAFFWPIIVADGYIRMRRKKQ
jgi:hypothetical protein